MKNKYESIPELNNIINFFINSFGIYSAIFIFLQFERYEGNSEKWDLLLFGLLLAFTFVIFYLLYTKNNSLDKASFAISSLLVYTIIKGVGVFEYRDFKKFEYSSELYIWLGFGIPVLIIALIVSPLVTKILFDNSKIFKIIRLVLFVYLLCSFILTYFQRTNSLIDTFHSSYIFDELLALKAGSLPFYNFIPQYQSFYSFIGFLVPDTELIKIVDIYLILFFLSYLLITFQSVKWIKNSSEYFNYINSTILFMPFLVVAPIFYNRIGSGGTIPSLLSNYPIRLLPFFIIFVILKFGYSFEKKKIEIVEKKFVSFAFFLAGLNLYNNFEFGIVTLLSITSLILLLEFIQFKKLNINQKVFYIIPLFLGIILIPILYYLNGYQFNFDYLGYFVRSFVSSNSLGIKIAIPGPSLFLVPLIFSTFISHIKILSNTNSEIENYNLIQRNSFIGISIGLVSIFGLPYYINTSYAAGQLQFFLLLISLNFCIFLGSMIALKKFNIFLDIKNSNLNEKILIFTIAIFIASTVISSTPYREIQRLSNDTENQSWPDYEMNNIFSEIVEIKSMSPNQNIGYLGNYSRVVGYHTDIHPLSLVSGVENVNINGKFEFQQELYKVSCDEIFRLNIDYVVVDRIAFYKLALDQNFLCEKYVLNSDHSFEYIFVLEK